MRHRKKLNRLGLGRAHRRILLKNLATSLVMRGSIETTVIKAKALRSYVARLIAVAKQENTMNAIRRLHVLLTNEEASKKLLSVLKKRYENRSSGFTRLTPVKYRKGDNAKIIRIELLA